MDIQHHNAFAKGCHHLQKILLFVGRELPIKKKLSIRE